MSTSFAENFIQVPVNFSGILRTTELASSLTTEQSLIVADVNRVGALSLRSWTIAATLWEVEPSSDVAITLNKKVWSSS